MLETKGLGATACQTRFNHSVLYIEPQGVLYIEPQHVKYVLITA